MLRGYAASDLGRARVAALVPSVDLAWIQNQQQLTAEIREFGVWAGDSSSRASRNFREFAGEGSYFGRGVGNHRDSRRDHCRGPGGGVAGDSFNSSPQGMKQDWAAVRQLSSGITDFTDFLRGFRNKILPDGTLDDRASPALASVRREIEKTEALDPGIVTWSAAEAG